MKFYVLGIFFSRLYLIPKENGYYFEMGLEYKKYIYFSL